MTKHKTLPRGAQDPLGELHGKLEFGLRELELGLDKHFSYLL